MCLMQGGNLVFPFPFFFFKEWEGFLVIMSLLSFLAPAVANECDTGRCLTQLGGSAKKKKNDNTYCVNYLSKTWQLVSLDNSG